MENAASSTDSAGPRVAAWVSDCMATAGGDEPEPAADSVSQPAMASAEMNRQRANDQSVPSHPVRLTSAGICRNYHGPWLQATVVDASCTPNVEAGSVDAIEGNPSPAEPEPMRPSGVRRQPSTLSSEP